MREATKHHIVWNKMSVCSKNVGERGSLTEMNFLKDGKDENVVESDDLLNENDFFGDEDIQSVDSDLEPYSEVDVANTTSHSATTKAASHSATIKAVSHFTTNKLGPRSDIKNASQSNLKRSKVDTDTDSISGSDSDLSSVNDLFMQIVKPSVKNTVEHVVSFHSTTTPTGPITKKPALKRKNFSDSDSDSEMDLAPSNAFQSPATKPSSNISNVKLSSSTNIEPSTAISTAIHSPTTSINKPKGKRVPPEEGEKSLIGKYYKHGAIMNMDCPHLVEEWVPHRHDIFPDFDTLVDFVKDWGWNQNVEIKVRSSNKKNPNKMHGTLQKRACVKIVIESFEE